MRAGLSVHAQQAGDSFEGRCGGDPSWWSEDGFGEEEEALLLCCCVSPNRRKRPQKSRTRPCPVRGAPSQEQSAPPPSSALL